MTSVMPMEATDSVWLQPLRHHFESKSTVSESCSAPAAYATLDTSGSTDTPLPDLQSFPVLAFLVHTHLKYAVKVSTSSVRPIKIAVKPTTRAPLTNHLAGASPSRFSSLPSRSI